VLEAIEALGYRRNAMARALKTRRSHRLGVIASDLQERGPSMLMVAVQEAALAAGYEISLVGLSEMTPQAVRAAVDRVVEQDVEALLVTVTHAEVRSLAEQHVGAVPFVFVEGVVEGAPGSAGTAQRAGAHLATTHLLQLGHEAVAHVTGPASWIESSERKAGWHQAHVDADREPGLEIEGDWTARSGYLAGVELAARRDVTAVFTANDQMALGLLHAMREAGRQVPDEVSIVGFDDLPEAAYFAPPLTTVRQDFPELGRRAVDLAVRLLGGETEPRAPLVPTELVVRGSTAPARSA